MGSGALSCLDRNVLNLVFSHSFYPLTFLTNWGKLCDIGQTGHLWSICGAPVKHSRFASRGSVLFLILLVVLDIGCINQPGVKLSGQGYNSIVKDTDRKSAGLCPASDRAGVYADIRSYVSPSDQPPQSTARAIGHEVMVLTHSITLLQGFAAPSVGPQ